MNEDCCRRLASNAEWWCWMVDDSTIAMLMHPCQSDHTAIFLVFQPSGK
jgi:hypothetical protein